MSKNEQDTFSSQILRPLLLVMLILLIMLVFFIIRVLHNLTFSLAKRESRIIRNGPVSWNFVGQPQWEPWINSRSKIVSWPGGTESIFLTLLFCGNKAAPILGTKSIQTQGADQPNHDASPLSECVVFWTKLLWIDCLTNMKPGTDRWLPAVLVLVCSCICVHVLEQDKFLLLDNPPPFPSQRSWKFGSWKFPDPEIFRFPGFLISPSLHIWSWKLEISRFRNFPGFLIFPLPTHMKLKVGNLQFQKFPDFQVSQLPLPPVYKLGSKKFLVPEISRSWKAGNSWTHLWDEVLYCRFTRLAAGSPRESLLVLQSSKTMFYRDGDHEVTLWRQLGIRLAVRDTDHCWLRQKLPQQHASPGHGELSFSARLARSGQPTGARSDSFALGLFGKFSCEAVGCDEWDVTSTSTRPLFPEYSASIKQNQEKQRVAFPDICHGNTLPFSTIT